MIYCGNPDCIKKVKSEKELYICCGFEKRICIKCLKNYICREDDK